MPIDDPTSYQVYSEDRIEVGRKLDFVINQEKLQDELRRVKKSLSFENLARLIPETVSEYAKEFPTGGNISTQNLYDFLKLKSPSMPSPDRRLAYHAFLMIVDERYREKWNGSHFVQRAGRALVEFFATDRKTNPYAHATNLQQTAGIYEYDLQETIRASISKPSLDSRCLFLVAAKDQPFMLAYDFDVVGKTDKAELEGSDYSSEQITHLQQSWDLDARVGFYIPKRSVEEGILLLNSYKWDWPTIYACLLNYIVDERLDDSEKLVSDILLTDVNSYLNIDRVEKSYFESDHEIPDGRKLLASRRLGSSENLERLSDLLERKFDWGVDL